MSRTMFDEHFRLKGREKWYESVEEIQAGLGGVLQPQAQPPGLPTPGAHARSGTARGDRAHYNIHHAVTSARCVLHTHMRYATALACTNGGVLEPISLNALRFYERIAYDDAFPGMALDDNEGQRLSSLLSRRFVLFIRNHGVTVIGADVGEAFDRLYFLEKACETQVLAMSTGYPLKPVDETTALRTRDQWES